MRIIGIDPSTAKLAFTTTVDGKIESMVAVPLPAKDRGNSRAGYAYHEVEKVVGIQRAFVFLEAPIYWRGGKSTIPLAQMSGVVQAAVHNLGHTLEMVNNQRWKTRVIGIGNANKEQIAEVMQKLWPEAYALADGDQDLIDAAAINLYGQQIMGNRQRIKKGM